MEDFIRMALVEHPAPASDKVRLSFFGTEIPDEIIA